MQAYHKQFAFSIKPSSVDDYCKTTECVALVYLQTISCYVYMIIVIFFCLVTSYDRYNVTDSFVDSCCFLSFVCKQSLLRYYAYHLSA